MENQERDAGGYTPGQIRALKIAIGVMTGAIVLGLIVMVLTIAYRAAGSKRAGSANTEPLADLRSQYPGSGAIADIKIPAGARLVSVAPWSDRLVLVLEDAGGSSLIVLDPKSGKVEPLARLQPAP